MAGSLDKVIFNGLFQLKPFCDSKLIFIYSFFYIYFKYKTNKKFILSKLRS